jgi:hypothetical protein
MSRLCFYVTYDSGLTGGNKDITEGSQSGRVFSMLLVAKYILLGMYFVSKINKHQNKRKQKRGSVWGGKTTCTKSVLFQKEIMTIPITIYDLVA